MRIVDIGSAMINRATFCYNLLHVVRVLPVAIEYIVGISNVCQCQNS